MRVLAVVLVALALVAVSAESLTDKEYQYLFSKWVKQHQKSYKVDDFFNRFSVFKQNLDMIRAHNAKNLSWTLGMNHLGDLTAEEFKAHYLGYKPVIRSFLRSQNEVSFKGDVSALPTSVDWRQHNAVTAVKNQQQCGSCWAFSTTGSVEGAWAIAKGNLVSLSEQQLVDCSASAGNNGCNGGLMDNAFEWIISNKGLCTEASYPYQAAQGTCQSCTPVATLSSFKDVTSGDENALQAAVAQQPVSVAIEADQAVFQFYSGGVLNDQSCGTQLDHGVLVVGYGVDATAGNYWIVKNSWGATWGENGYIRLSRGNNMCGISQEPSYPIV